VEQTPVDIVRRLLGDPTNPQVVAELVADDSVYVSLNFEDPDLKRIMPWCGTGHGSAALLQTFTDVARYWRIEEFEITDIFGSDNRVAAFGPRAAQSRPCLLPADQAESHLRQVARAAGKEGSYVTAVPASKAATAASASSPAGSRAGSTGTAARPAPSAYELTSRGSM
jgi:hypothetical protein